MSHAICRYYNTPKGCCRPNCSFRHSGSPGGPSESMHGSSAPRASSHLAPHGANPRTASSTNAPRGVCNFYWTSGKCKHEFQCRFRHTASPSVAASGSSQAAHVIQSTPAINDIAPFLTEAGLAKLTGTGTDFYFSNEDAKLSPNEAHNYLKTFLYDDYRFRTTQHIYAFLTIITNASAMNASWVCQIVAVLPVFVDFPSLNPRLPRTDRFVFNLISWLLCNLTT
jgi:hypothetical protein